MPTTKEFKLEELSKYFHMPEKAVAKELGICLTSLKKLCRSYGITRWPFRKVNVHPTLEREGPNLTLHPQLKSIHRTLAKAQDESSTSMVAAQFIGGGKPSDKAPMHAEAGGRDPGGAHDSALSVRPRPPPPPRVPHASPFKPLLLWSPRRPAPAPAARYLAIP